MGHYDNYRHGHCSVCGQTGDACGHDKMNPDPDKKPSANDIQYGGSHYKGAKFQHWDLVAKNQIGYLEGCASKYASRYPRKNGVEDVQKGVHYCDKLIEMAETGYKPTGRAPYSDLQRFLDENDVRDRDAQLAIAHLCTWDSMVCLTLARKHMTALLANLIDAQAAAA